MKINKAGKNISAVIAIICGSIYFLGGLLYPITPVASEMIWGMAVFFACLCWFTDLEE